MPTFGDYLRTWREDRGFKKAELARLIGISATYLGNLEQNRSNHSTKPPQISRDLCSSLARVLQVPLATVLMAAFVPELMNHGGVDAQTRRLLACFEELPSEAQQNFVIMIEALWRHYAAVPPSEPHSGQKLEVVRKPTRKITL
jgi:transcriptional regulator with XRE-family HTH domain